jgi:hypothetical protein
MDRPSGWTTYYCVENLWKAGNSTLEPCNVPPAVRDASVDVFALDAMHAADRELVDVLVSPEGDIDGTFVNGAESP